MSLRKLYWRMALVGLNEVTFSDLSFHFTSVILPFELQHRLGS